MRKTVLMVVTVIAVALSLFFSSGTEAANPNTSVLVIADVLLPTVGCTNQLINALISAGLTVTTSSTPGYQYDGTNPALSGYGAVIHLNGRAPSYTTDMPAAGQTALVNYVQNGGTYVGNEWNAYQFSKNQLQSMRELILFDRVGGSAGNITFAKVSSHPIIANVPDSFTFSGYYNVGYVHAFSANPATVLMRDVGGDAVAVRSYGSGNVIGFHMASNYFDSPNPLCNPNVQQLYVDAVKFDGSLPPPPADDGSTTPSAQPHTWTVDADFNGGNLDSTQLSPANQVVLGRTPVSKTHVVWTDNFNYGLVVKLDTVTGKQLARYDSVLQTINGQSTGVRPANEVCNWSNTGNCPGRIAVDANGDVWIANRAFGTQGSIARIAGDISRCIDRNNNGVINTSGDVNGDGIIDMDPAHGEYFGQNDECILTTIPVGVVNAIPRGLAIDKWGKVWVGNYNEKKLYRFNPDEPVTLEATVTLPGTINPYTIASGGDYIFVSNSNSGAAGRVHITTLAVDTAPCPASYAVTADPGGTKAWLGTYSSGISGIFLADFNNHTCTTMNNAGNGPTTAVTLDIQPAPGPYVWSANYATNTISKYTAAGTYLGTYPGGGTSRTHGLSVDFQGNLWVLSDTANAQKMISKVNPATGALIGSYSIGFLASDGARFPAIGGSYSDPATPYAYGDLTGVQLDRQSPYTRIGSWAGIYDSGRAGTPWLKVTWNIEAQGAVPANTTLQVSVRAAGSLAALERAGYVPATNGTVLSGVVGRYVQVRAELKGPGWLTSVLSDITVTPADVDTVCTVASGTSPSSYLQPVTFTASVTSGVGIPSGTVTFFDGATPICTDVSLDSGGQATCDISSLAGGQHTITATYSGAGNYKASSGTVEQTVMKADQTITVTTHAPASALYNTSLHIAAQSTVGLGVEITSSGACSGSGTGTADIMMTGGSATCTVSFNQEGDGNYNAAPQVIETTALLHSLGISSSGSGSGNVSGNLINCSWNGTGQSGTCGFVYYYGTQFDLAALPGSCSFLRQWQGNVCGGNTSPCSVTMTEEKSVGGVFDLYSLIWFTSPVNGYQTLTDGYAQANEGTAINIQAQTFPEDLDLGLPIGVSFNAGWNCDFNQKSGMTKIRSLTITNGSVGVENIEISVP